MICIKDIDIVVLVCIMDEEGKKPNDNIHPYCIDSNFDLYKYENYIGLQEIEFDLDYDSIYNLDPFGDDGISRGEEEEEEEYEDEDEEGHITKVGNLLPTYAKHTTHADIDEKESYKEEEEEEQEEEEEETTYSFSSLSSNLFRDDNLFFDTNPRTHSVQPPSSSLFQVSPSIQQPIIHRKRSPTLSEHSEKRLRSFLSSPAPYILTPDTNRTLDSVIRTRTHDRIPIITPPPPPPPPSHIFTREHESKAREYESKARERNSSHSRNRDISSSFFTPEQKKGPSPSSSRLSSNIYTHDKKINIVTPLSSRTGTHQRRDVRQTSSGLFFTPEETTRRRRRNVLPSPSSSSFHPVLPRYTSSNQSYRRPISLQTQNTIPPHSFSHPTISTSFDHSVSSSSSSPLSSSSYTTTTTTTTTTDKRYSYPTPSSLSSSSPILSPPYSSPLRPFRTSTLIPNDFNTFPMEFIFVRRCVPHYLQLNKKVKDVVELRCEHAKRYLLTRRMHIQNKCSPELVDRFLVACNQLSFWKHFCNVELNVYYGHEQDTYIRTCILQKKRNKHKDTSNTYDSGLIYDRKAAFILRFAKLRKRALLSIFTNTLPRQTKIKDTRTYNEAYIDRTDLSIQTSTNPCIYNIHMSILVNACLYCLNTKEIQVCISRIHAFAHSNISNMFTQEVQCMLHLFIKFLTQFQTRLQSKMI
jgi:hypothetical protein